MMCKEMTIFVENLSLIFRHTFLLLQYVCLQSSSVSVIYCKSAAVSCHKKQCNLVLIVKTAASLGKGMYQPSFKIQVSFTFTNNVKGLH